MPLESRILQPSILFTFPLSPTQLPNNSSGAKVDALGHQKKKPPNHLTVQLVTKSGPQGQQAMHMGIPSSQLADFLAGFLPLEHFGMFKGLHISDKREECRGFDCKLPLCSANHMWFLAPFPPFWPKGPVSARVRASTPNPLQERRHVVPPTLGNRSHSHG